MLFLLFQIGNDRYGLPSNQVAEIVPVVQMKKIPQVPAGVAGLINYHGSPVPVIDLTEITTGRPASRCFSTRTILIHYPAKKEENRLLGLMAEKATRTVQLDPAAFVDPGITGKETPYLGPVLHDAGGFIQWIKAEALLPEPLREALFP
jgi:chemotaxis-related protein WspB